MDDEENYTDTHRGELQAQRLVQLRGMRPEALGALIEQMHIHAYLPRLQMHFRQHGHEFGTSSVEEYERRFQEHVMRNNLQRFTFVRPETGDIRWHLVDPVTGYVAIYNETRMRYWSFFRNRNVQKFLRGFRDYWVEVFPLDEDWQFEPW